MKRASFDFHQSDKHQTLLQEYLELQKEFVSKKRKLQTAKQNRDNLMAEIRFLRGRRKYLLKIQSPELEPVKNVVHQQNSDIQRKIQEKGKKYSGYEAALGNPYPVLVPHSTLRDNERKGEGEREDQLVREAFRVEKKPMGYSIDDRKIKKSSKSYLIDEKRIGKKKISWQDPVILKV
ncbi:hypothetical protein LguiA_036576 [Lonicera macranthoides]